MPVETPQPRKFSLSVLLATGLGLGMSPWAPGTIGTLWGIPITIGMSFIEPFSFRLLAVFAGIAAGVVVCHAAARRLGGKDPSAVVWDEFATVPLVFLPLATEYWRSPWALAIGFLLHRLFDISKLPPVNYAESLPGGWGIMLDDVLAAAYAAVVMVFLHHLGILG